MPGPQVVIAHPHGREAERERRGLPPVVFLLLVPVLLLSVGTLGYMSIEGWSAADALYMTVITVTTVGYREVHPMTRVGEAFTVALLLTGVGTFFYVLSLFVAGLVHVGFAAKMGGAAARPHA